MKIKPLRFKRLVYKDTLSNGHKIEMRFSFDAYVYPRVTEIVASPSLLVYRGNKRKAWKKEGKATGPGGVEAFSVAIEMMKRAQVDLAYLFRKSKNPVYIEVTGATPELFKIYRARLKRIGFIDAGYRDDLVHYPVKS